MKINLKMAIYKGSGLKMAARSRGFTLIELMITIAILAIIASIAVTSYAEFVQRGRVAEAQSELSTLAAELLILRDRTGSFPQTPEEVSDRGLLPRDPWGNNYQYIAIEAAGEDLANLSVRRDRNNVPLNSDFDIYSTGKDGLSSLGIGDPNSADDVIRARNGVFIGKAADYE